MEYDVANDRSVRDAFVPHLPHLRRYARALTGAQTSGDAYVRMALETMLGAPDEVDLATVEPRLALYRLFTAVSQEVTAAGPADLPAGCMQALLLTEVEGFSVQEAAVILDVPEADIAAKLQHAKAMIAALICSRVLIIEDEPMIALHLEQIVEDMGHEVSALAMTHEDALTRAHEVSPELVLADIQLADGSSGLEATCEILKSFDVPVVFITAFPERLLTGERPEPTFLVTKPFNVETVVATIGQALLTRAFKNAERA